MKERTTTQDGSELIHIHNINTFMAAEGNETHLCGEDQHGQPVHLIFNTIELLEWLDIEHMKRRSIDHIKSL